MIRLNSDNDTLYQEEKFSETDNKAKNSIHEFNKKGELNDLIDVKESICIKHYDEEGNKYYNEYKFIKFLGSGAFSKIELVEKDGEKFAMKKIDKEFLKSQKNLEYDENGKLIINSSFENALKEIAILKKTNHPDIIRLYEIMYCKKNKKIYLILEYCEHGDLMYYDEEKDKLFVNNHIVENRNDKNINKDYYTNEEILKFLNDIISGIYYLHINGIIHRDIKPNNILLDKKNNCKITDFNVSTILENLKGDKTRVKICGADHFLPPETCNIFLKKDKKENIGNEEKEKEYRGKPIDIWALGVTTYILSYNKFPFELETNNLFELYKKISKAEYEIPDYPNRSNTIKKIIKCCLEKNPNNRITIKSLSNFPFINKTKFWNSNKNIEVFEKEILKSIKFFCPSCVTVFKTEKSQIRKEFDTSKIKYKQFFGKIKFLSLFDIINSTIEDKYGVFVVDGMIFRKEDFGMKSYYNTIEEKKKRKTKYFTNYRKCIIGRSYIV